MNLDFVDELVEEEINEEDNSTEDSKLERYQINSFQQDKPVETLIKWLRNGKLILPTFQRDYVWSFSNSCRLIESVLLNLPIPNIFLFKVKNPEGEKFLLIDGLQRMTTIEQYIDGTWSQGEKKRTFKISSPNENWDRKTFDDLDEDDQQFIYDYSIGTTIFETSSGSKVDENNVIFSVFERINTGSEKLSDQEIRNAIYNGECLAELKDLSNNPNYQILIRNDNNIIKRGKHIELLLRFIAYYHIYKAAVEDNRCLVDGDIESKITTSKKIMLNNYLYFSNCNKIDYKNEINELIEAINIISQFDDSAFYSKLRDSDEIGKKVHELFAEALVIAVILNDYKIDIEKEDFISEKIQLWNDEQRLEFFKSKTTDPNTVKERVKILLDIIRGM